LGFHKMLGVSRVAAQLVASRVMLSSIESIELSDCMNFDEDLVSGCL
jgi:hypothetical protein